MLLAEESRPVFGKNRRKHRDRVERRRRDGAISRVGAGGPACEGWVVTTIAWQTESAAKTAAKQALSKVPRSDKAAIRSPAVSRSLNKPCRLFPDATAAEQFCRLPGRSKDP